MRPGTSGRNRTGGGRRRTGGRGSMCSACACRGRTIRCGWSCRGGPGAGGCPRPGGRWWPGAGWCSGGFASRCPRDSGCSGTRRRFTHWRGWSCRQGGADWYATHWRARGPSADSAGPSGVGGGCFTSVTLARGLRIESVAGQCVCLRRQRRSSLCFRQQQRGVGPRPQQRPRRRLRQLARRDGYRRQLLGRHPAIALVFSPALQRIWGRTPLFLHNHRVANIDVVEVPLRVCGAQADAAVADIFQPKRIHRPRR